VVLVNTMTESHKDLLLVLYTLYESGDILNVSNLLKHTENSLVCTTMTGTIQSGDGTSK
jgi:hypothetical protein